MRVWLVALFLVMFIPIAPAQSEAPLGEDPAGDVSSPVGLPTPPNAGEIDLRSFTVREDAKDFHFDIVVDTLAAEAAAGFAFTSWDIEFQHNGQRFAVNIQRGNVVGTTDFFARVAEYDPGRNTYSTIGTADVAASWADNAITVDVPREWLRDADGAPPAPGRTLDNFVVKSSANELIGEGMAIQGIPIPSPHYEDRMPDDGVLPGAHAIQFGVASTGHLSLSSEEPFRASNGEATTFVFYVTANNDGSEDDTVRFEATGFPAQWDITLPSDMQLAAGAQTDVPVIVRTAFAHSHGATASFILSMKSSQDASAVGRLEMGVYYPLIPQPAGHHDTLYIHTTDRSGDPAAFAVATAFGTVFSGTGLLQSAYMNAVEDDERADEVPADGQKCQIIALDPDYPVGTGYCWRLDLDPGLVLGLDFDLSRVGQLTASISSLAPLPGASLEGRLIYQAPPEDDTCNPFCGSRETTVLATINRTPLVDLMTGGDHTFEAEIVPTPESDLIPYQKGGSMTLELQVSTLRPDTWIYGPPLPPPALKAGGQIVLPLNEYADPVADVIDFGRDGIKLLPIGEQERAVNPGKTVVFRAELRNPGNATQVSLEIIGGNRDWSQLIGQSTFKLAAGENKTIALTVTPPSGALDGEVADLVLQASNLNDIAQRSLVRFVAQVDTTQDIPDESALAKELMPAEAKKSPGAAPLLVIALAALAMRRR